MIYGSVTGQSMYGYKCGVVTKRYKILGVTSYSDGPYTLFEARDLDTNKSRLLRIIINDTIQKAENILLKQFYVMHSADIYSYVITMIEVNE